MTRLVGLVIRTLGWITVIYGLCCSLGVALWRGIADGIFVGASFLLAGSVLIWFARPLCTPPLPHEPGEKTPL